MKAPAFWWREKPGLAATLLAPGAMVLGTAAAWRMRRPPAFRAPVPVICVGNLVVGGAGKTPTALALAEAAYRRGMRPGFVASGYGGAASGPRLVAAGDAAAVVGDEALLLAAVAPTAVGRDRVAAARLLVEPGAVNLILMDDGLQNPGLAKDVSLAVVDAGAGIGNAKVLPAGPLRAPLGTQLARVDRVLVVGEGAAATPVIQAAEAAAVPVLRASLAPVAAGWRGRRVLAFAGIGRPQKFFDSLVAAGAAVVRSASFADHHVYTETEARTLMADADAAALTLVTTEKDRARLAGTAGALARLRERAESFPVRLVFADPGAADAILDAALAKARSA